MKVSIIICSCDRPEMLKACLASVEAEAALYHGTEIVLVHRRDDTGTADVMCHFAQGARCAVTVLAAEKRGLSVARNVGIKGATGDLLFFTDDDCLMKPGHLGAMIAEMESEPAYDYGGGGVYDPVLSSPDRAHVVQKTVIPPHTLVNGGIFSGCNMFFRRSVFEKIGFFREDMGAGSGMPFVGAEDLEMTTRANMSGMTGVLVPGAIIVHDHKRQPNSSEHIQNQNSYDISRGSFYAYMLMHGIYEVWGFWGTHFIPKNTRKTDRHFLEVLQREFFGASEYLKHCLKNNIDL